MNRLFSLVVVLIAAVGSVYAQFPIPAPPGAEVASCAGCPPPRTGYDAEGTPILGAPPYPISYPIVWFTGRFLDSNFTKDLQQPFRTARAWRAAVYPARNRIYLQLGSAVAAYSASGFFQRLEGKEPLLSVEVPFGRIRYGDWPEYFLWWDKYFYAEKNGTGWNTPIMDGQERLIGFDVDDRGYVYMAYSSFGWGIARDDGGADGHLMESQIQMIGDGFTPTSIFTFKNSAGKYFALVGPTSANVMRVYDTTNPKAPVLMNASITGTTYAAVAGDRIALVTRDGKLQIFTVDDIVNGGAPLSTHAVPGPGSAYVNVTTDGTNFFAVGREGAKYAVNVLTRTFAGGFQENYANLRQSGYPYTIRWGAGFVTITGLDSTSGENLFLYRVNGTQLSEIYLNDFFFKYYVSPGAGYSKPFRGTVYNALPVVNGSKLHLVVSAFGLGDVYQIAAAGYSAEPPPPVLNPPPAPVPTPQPPPTPTPTPPPPTPVPGPPPVPSACPAMNSGQSIVYIGFRNTSNSCNQQDPNCQAGETLQFTALGWNYDFACATHQFTWDFGGVQKVGRDVSHAFGPGRHTVKLRISNNVQTVNVEQQVNVNTSRRRSARH